MGRLQDKITIITGAGSGIGRASALCFAREGAVVVVNDLHPDTAEATTTEIVSAGGRALAHPADMTDAAQVAGLVDRAIDAFGRLDVFFANAGGALPTPTHETSLETYRQIIALNLDAVFYAVHFTLPVMMRQGSGVILATSSGAGLNAVPGLAAYGAAKAAVINLMRNVAVEYGPMGIRANSIAPGPMLTPGAQRWLDTMPDRGAGYAKQVPSGRLGTPEDIAAAALFLASDEADYINGAMLSVDGAIHAQLAAPKPG
jgi:3-oxoacyl-[acyl-carrier protein] reductase